MRLCSRSGDVRRVCRVRRAQCAPPLPLQPPIQVVAPPLLFAVAPPPRVHLAHSQVQGAVHLWTQEETVHLTTHPDPELFVLTCDQQAHSALVILKDNPNPNPNPNPDPELFVLTCDQQAHSALVILKDNPNPNPNPSSKITLTLTHPQR
ncbi:hypothetical protein EYF80_066956 [Liparis tanakae]|uniref:Uncharacterized protein n=1 Tax=Liparis tanakae TaxID=230148 RepID=A0A4Z2E2G9_9TELE|nr:hypothetical protein EYF80_066956 [Liparis tanakae]